MADLNDINNEIDRIEEAKGEIADAIRETGVEVPENVRLGAYPPLIRRIPETLKEIFWAQYGVTTASEIDQAIAAGKAVMMIFQERIFYLNYKDADHYYFQSIYLNNLYRLYITISTDVWSGMTTVGVEDRSNKTQTLEGNETSTSKYPSTKAVYDALPKDVVQYVEQTLTEAQRAQARQNIGATAPEVFWATYGTTTAAEIEAAREAGKVVVMTYSNGVFLYAQKDATYLYFESPFGDRIRRIKLNRNSNVWDSGITNVYIQDSTRRVNIIEGYISTTYYPSTKAVADALGKMGVVSQTQTWTGSNAAGWDYTMSNIVRGLIPQSFIDMATANIGVVFNDSTGYFELNGLTDISYQEMVTILSYGMCPRPDNVLYIITGWGGRTTLPYLSQIGFGALGRYNMSSGSRGAVCEVILLARTPAYLENTLYGSADWSYAFQSCPHLKKVIGEWSIPVNSQNFSHTFDLAYSLESIKIRSLNANISFYQSSRLTLDSVVYLVDNAANTAAITITLHATAYARCQADTTEYTYNGQTYTGIIAYAAARNITIQSA